MTATLPRVAPRPRTVTVGGAQVGRTWASLGVWAVAVLAVLPFALYQLLRHDPLMDLQVYRAAGTSLRHGTGVYDFFLPKPGQDLPFTYPPTAAAVAFPLAFLGVGLLNVLWTLAVYAVLVPVVARSFGPLLTRLGPQRAALALPLLWAGASYLKPVRDNVLYGQVGVFLLALVLVDVTTRGRGWRIALATAIKLTPGVFVLMYAAAGRWRQAAQAAGLTLLVIAATAVVLPGTSRRYWTDALFDNSRLGPNASFSNQSLRGMLLHTTLSTGVQQAIWVPSLLLVGGVGFVRARRALRNEDLLAAAAVTGLLACLLSPVAWMHHHTVIVVCLGVLVGAGHQRRRLAWAGALAVLFWLNLPAVGYHRIRGHDGLLGLSSGVVHPLWVLFEDAFGIAAVVLVVLLPYRPAPERSTSTPPVS